jgi:hypothetical protein
METSTNFVETPSLLLLFLTTLIKIIFISYCLKIKRHVKTHLTLDHIGIGNNFMNGTPIAQ